MQPLFQVLISIISLEENYHLSPSKPLIRKYFGIRTLSALYVTLVDFFTLNWHWIYAKTCHLNIPLQGWCLQLQSVNAEFTQNLDNDEGEYLLCICLDDYFYFIAILTGISEEFTQYGFFHGKLMKALKLKKA